MCSVDPSIVPLLEEKASTKLDRIVGAEPPAARHKRFRRQCLFALAAKKAALRTTPTVVIAPPAPAAAPMTFAEKRAATRKMYGTTAVIWKKFVRPNERTTVVAFFDGDNLKKAQPFQIVDGQATRQGNNAWLQKRARDEMVRDGGWLVGKLSDFPMILDLLAEEMKD